MNCTQARQALPLLIYDGLEPGEAAALREHLACCAECRREQAALQGLQTMLDSTAAPAAQVDLARVYQAAAEQQARRLRRWRRGALAFGAIAASLLLVFGLRLEIRVQAGQAVVRWGNSAAPSPAPVSPPLLTDSSPQNQDELRILSELIHALKQDADARDRQAMQRIDELQIRVQLLQLQADRRWTTTEENVSALYVLAQKGEKP
jgi:hypothetical protein